MMSLSTLLAGDVVQAAAGVVGCVLARRLPDGVVLRTTIVEAEAYHMREPGCHAHRGMTPRTAVMFGPPGRLYVYFTYGMWHCCNIVCEQEGVAAAVLLRAATQILPKGKQTGTTKLRLSGPGLLCQGIKIDRKDNGTEILSRKSDIWLYRPAGFTPPPLTWTTRIGFSFPDLHRWRCFWTGHPDISPGRPGVLVKSKRRKKD